MQAVAGDRCLAVRAAGASSSVPAAGLKQHGWSCGQWHRQQQGGSLAVATGSATSAMRVAQLRSDPATMQ